MAAKCAVHVQKIQGQGLGGVRNHMMRTGESRTNPDIDYDRSPQNWSVDGLTAAHLERRINARIKSLNLKRAPRKDAVRLCTVLVTASKEAMDAMGATNARNYLSEAARWLRERFGSENTMYAIVHEDEQTPHLHFGFVPVTKDGRLSAKALLTQNSLRALQTEFAREVAAKYGLERGEEGNTKRKHIETARYKAEHAQKAATQAKKEATQEEERARAAQEINNAKQAAIDAAANAQTLVEGVRARRVSPFLGDPYYRLSTDDYDALHRVAEGGAAAIEEHLAMEATVKRAEKRAREAREGMKLAQSGQRAAERRVEHVVQERDDLRREAAPYLDAPEVARPLAEQGIAWAREAFRATWDTVMRFMARAGVLRGEKARDVATRYAQPMKELGMEQGAAIPRAAAKAMTRQIRGRAPQAQKGAGWVAPPEAVDYLAKDAPDEVVAAVLSPAALRALDENIEDGVTWDMLTELERDEIKHRQLGREI
jgi:hypothetical protein